jgi:hypothetical protein
MDYMYPTIMALIEADERGDIDDDTFDYELWLMLMDRIEGPDDRSKFDDAVMVFYASRLMEWEVANGGFSQAAYNYPDWFGLSAWAYRQLGCGQAASLIEEAIPLLARESRETESVCGIGELFEHFSESTLGKLDERLDESGWWATQARLKYVRERRDSFRKIS